MSKISLCQSFENNRVYLRSVLDMRITLKLYLHEFCRVQIDRDRVSIVQSNIQSYDVRIIHLHRKHLRLFGPFSIIFNHSWLISTLSWKTLNYVFLIISVCCNCSLICSLRSIKQITDVTLTSLLLSITQSAIRVSKMEITVLAGAVSHVGCLSINMHARFSALLMRDMVRESFLAENSKITNEGAEDISFFIKTMCATSRYFFADEQICVYVLVYARLRACVCMCNMYIPVGYEERHLYAHPEPARI